MGNTFLKKAAKYHIQRCKKCVSTQKFALILLFSNIAGIPDLYNISGESVIEPHPVARRNHTDASHTAEDPHPYPAPVIAEITRVDLSTEDGQDQGQHCQQVDLPPKLQDKESNRLVTV